MKVAATLVGITFFVFYAQCVSAQFETKLVELDTFESTGKRHQSYFFTFRSQEDQNHIIRSQEIYWDFGGKQILSKIYGPESFSKPTENDKPVVICYSCNDSDLCSIKWVAEPYRVKSLQRLESFLRKNYEQDSLVISEALLKEMNGKTSLPDYKIAIELLLGGGNWKIAKIED